MKYDEDFNFKIGQRVKHKLRDPRFDGEKKEILFVVQREIDQCPGGEQYHYQCRVMNKDGMHISIVKFNEVELTEFDAEEEAGAIRKRKYDTFIERQRMENQVRKELREEELRQEAEDKNKE